MTRQGFLIRSFLYTFLCIPFIIAAVVDGAPSAFSQDVIIIGHPEAPQNNLSPSDVRQIFLGQKRTWDNGDSLSFVIMRGSDTHASFLRQYIQRSPSQYVAYWRQMLFSGRGRLPTSLATDEEIIEFVASNPGAVGYISASTSPEHVKIISISVN